MKPRDRPWGLWLLVALLLALSIGPAIFNWQLIAGYAAIPTEAVTLLREESFAGAGEVARNSGAGLAIGEDGTFYIADATGRQLIRLAPGASATRLVVGRPPAGASPLVEPVAVALAPDGHVLVLDLPTGWVHFFTREGVWKRALPLASPGARALAVDAAGNLYIGDTGALVVRKYGPDLQPDPTWGWDPAKPGVAETGDAQGLGATTSGLLLVHVDSAVALDAAGRNRAWHRLVGRTGVLTGGSDGRFYLADGATNRIWVLDSEARTVARLVGREAEEIFAQPRAAVRRGDALYVLEESRVRVFQWVTPTVRP
jgi:hypothetical protein